MKIFRNLTLTLVISLLPNALCAQATTPQSNSGPKLLSAIVRMGHAQHGFQAKLFRQALENGSFEEAKLRAALGAENIATFDRVFTFIVNDTLTNINSSRRSLPTPSAPNLSPKHLARQLYVAGLDHGSFNIEQLFDTLFSPPIHEQTMMTIERKYGEAGESAYHQVFAKLITDLGTR